MKIKWYYIIPGIFIIWGTLSLIGIFSFIPEAKAHFQEAYVTEATKGIDYVINVNFKSKGAFIAEKKIDVEVEISRGIGKKFVNGENMMIVKNAFDYPIMKLENGMYKEASINLEIVDNGEKLIGSDTITFNSQGEHLIYDLLILSNEEDQIATKSKEKINIAGQESWLTIKQNERIFSLTLIIIALTLFSMLKPRKK